jgi:hypothetical protein
MAKEAKPSATSEYKLLEKLWEILEGESRGGIELNCLQTVIHAILKANHIVEKRCKDIVKAKDSSKKKIGKFLNKKDFCLNEEESKEMHKMFYLFYLNKIAQKKEVLPEPVYPHKPSLSKNTVVLASKSKERRINAFKRENIAVENVEEIMKSERDRQFNEMKIKIKEEEAKECTFKPKILEFASRQYKTLRGS